MKRMLSLSLALLLALSLWLPYGRAEAAEAFPELDIEITEARIIAEKAVSYLGNELWIPYLPEEDKNLELLLLAISLDQMHILLQQKGSAPPWLPGLLDNVDALETWYSDVEDFDLILETARDIRNDPMISFGPIQAGNPSAGAAVTAFSDVPESHWAYENIMLMVEYGVLTGTSEPVDGVATFEPEKPVTLGQLLAVLVRLAAPERIETRPDDTHWAMPYYRAAKEMDWIHLDLAHDSVEEALNNTVSRQYMARYLVGAAQELGEILPYSEDVGLSDMSHAYSKRAVYMSYYSGLLEGDENGWFRPAASTTRAALATVCCRLIGAVKRPTPYVDPDAEVFIPHPYFYHSLDANGLVIDDPEVRTHGELPTSSCRTYNLQALSLARAGIDSEGLYLTVTAPQLPAEIADDFVFDFWSMVYRGPDDDYFADVVPDQHITLKPGESATFRYQTWDGDMVGRGDFGNLSLSVSVEHQKDHAILSHRINLRSEGSVNESYQNSGDHYWDPFDDSAVWAGLSA